MPETIARFLREAGRCVPLPLRPVAEPAAHLRSGAHADGAAPLRDASRIGSCRRWSTRYPRLLDRPRRADDEQPGMGDARPSAVRGDAAPCAEAGAAELAGGACFYSLDQDEPGSARFLPGARRRWARPYRARAALRGGDRRRWRGSACGSLRARRPAPAALARRDCRRLPHSPRRRRRSHRLALRAVPRRGARGARRRGRAHRARMWNCR